MRKEIEKDSETILVTSEGVEVHFHADGSIDVYGDVPLRHHRGDTTIPEIGEVMEDGTVYAGISPTKGTRMFVQPTDAPTLMRWKDAAQYAFNLEAHGHKGCRQQTEKDLAGRKDAGWRLPTKAELNVLFQNRHKGALKGTFNEERRADYARLWYWSCTEDAHVSRFVWCQRFMDGGRGKEFKDSSELSVRCVRTEPRP